MREEQQSRLAKAAAPRSHYKRTRTDYWIFTGIVLGILEGFVYLAYLILFPPPTASPIVMSAGWIVAGLLSWWYFFRKML